MYVKDVFCFYGVHFVFYEPLFCSRLMNEIVPSWRCVALHHQCSGSLMFKDRSHDLPEILHQFHPHTHWNQIAKASMLLQL